ncbi:ABC transporter [Salmonella enterica]|nr:ABC transporter [Salmonella enterica]EBG4965606.1 sce7726 family protein [Salmonella enterica subsp. enterica serovar Agoueve]EDT8870835.1 sce7726 family protein [Salmonella enterica subsp. enterica]HAU7009350.1 sce7726 family protein [Salmonella enterica subsp. enterica serovar Berta]EAP7979963.1 ABC transporter [Salmonella enterica]
MAELLREQEVKVALIEWLYKKGMLSDATIINEMVVANWSRRADLAIANGSLQAFEIKSDFDSLKRLDGQLKIFKSSFEKVTIVCAPKFTSEVSKRVSSDVGVVEFQSNNSGVRFKIIQKGRVCSRLNKFIYLGFLLKSELKDLLNQHGITFSNELHRDCLEVLASKLSLNKIREFVITSIKNRYHATSNEFLSRLHGNQEISIGDLALLSKAKRRNNSLVKFEFKACSEKSLNEYHKVDVDSIVRKYGDDVSYIPEKVLKRVVS